MFFPYLPVLVLETREIVDFCVVIICVESVKILCFCILEFPLSMHDGVELIYIHSVIL